MTDREMLLRDLETEYLSKIYGFCRLKTNTPEDAEDLAQDIALEVLGAINRGKDIENLNAFVWSVSNHMFYNWLRRKKHGSTVHMPDIFAIEGNAEEEIIRREQTQILRRELALMSGNYRKAVVMHYFGNMTCEEIAGALGSSAGTVKWWLHDARKAIKEGMNTMKEYGEKSYNPGSLFMSCQYHPGVDMEPMSCAKRKSAQNILLAAYRKPMTVEELCIELGISAPYIEDEVDYLVKNQLMTEVSRGKYRTDFVILPGDNPNAVTKIYETCFPGYFDLLMEILERNKAELASEKMNGAGFSWERLLWVYIHIVTTIVIGKYEAENNIRVMYDDVPVRPNGGKWIALGFENGTPIDHKAEWMDYHPYDGPVHKLGEVNAQGFFHKWSGLDSTMFFDIPDGVFEICRDIIKGNVCMNELSEDQKYLLSIALEKKLLIKDGTGFKQNYYFADSDAVTVIERIADELYDTAAVYIKIAYDIVLSEYAGDVPEHLRWQMGNFLSNPLYSFVPCSLYEAKNLGLLSEPDEDNREWLSLFVWEK